MYEEFTIDKNIKIFGIVLSVAFMIACFSMLNMTEVPTTYNHIYERGNSEQTIDVKWEYNGGFRLDYNESIHIENFNITHDLFNNFTMILTNENASIYEFQSLLSPNSNFIKAYNNNVEFPYDSFNLSVFVIDFYDSVLINAEYLNLTDYIHIFESNVTLTLTNNSEIEIQYINFITNEFLVLEKTTNVYYMFSEELI